MGRPIEPPVVGIDCACCDGILWPAGQTPKHIIAHFWGIDICYGYPEGNLNGSFTLIQMPDSACSWECIVPYPWILYCRYILTSWSSSLFIMSPGGPPYFFVDSTWIPCRLRFSNICSCEEGDCAFGGHACIEIPMPAECSKIINDYGLHPMPLNRGECGRCADGKKWLLVANRCNKTNCLIKYDPSLVPP